MAGFGNRYTDNPEAKQSYVQDLRGIENNRLGGPHGDLDLRETDHPVFRWKVDSVKAVSDTGKDMRSVMAEAMYCAKCLDMNANVSSLREAVDSGDCAQIATILKAIFAFLFGEKANAYVFINHGVNVARLSELSEAKETNGDCEAAFYLMGSGFIRVTMKAGQILNAEVSILNTVVTPGDSMHRRVHFANML